MRIVFFGTPQFAVPSLQSLLDARHDVALVVAQPDRPAGRGMRLQTPPVIQLAREHHLQTAQPEKIRTPEFLDSIRAIAPDLGVVVAYGRILPEALLAIPKHGFINVHGSLLPKYRGAAPIQRAIEAGDLRTGVSIMRVDAELDHGPVLVERAIAIGPHDTTPTLAVRLADIGGTALAEAIRMIENGTAVDHEQNHAAATHAAKIEKEEGAVDWTMPAAAIYNRFRAFQPWPGVSAMVRGEAIKLTEIEPAAGGDAAPGIIARVDGTTLRVGTGNGQLLIRKMQRPGGRPLPASDVAAALGLKEGEAFQ